MFISTPIAEKEIRGRNKESQNGYKIRDIRLVGGNY